MFRVGGCRLRDRGWRLLLGGFELKVRGWRLMIGCLMEAGGSGLEAGGAGLLAMNSKHKYHMRSDQLSSIVTRSARKFVECLIHTVQPFVRKQPSGVARFWGPKMDPTLRPKALPLLSRCVLAS